jgi:hypothetical protein
MGKLRQVGTLAGHLEQGRFIYLGHFPFVVFHFEEAIT